MLDFSTELEPKSKRNEFLKKLYDLWLGALSNHVDPNQSFALIFLQLIIDSAKKCDEKYLPLLLHRLAYASLLARETLFFFDISSGCLEDEVIEAIEAKPGTVTFEKGSYDGSDENEHRYTIKTQEGLQGGIKI